MLVPPQSLHLLRMRWCSQLPPTAALHLLLAVLAKACPSMLSVLGLAIRRAMYEMMQILFHVTPSQAGRVQMLGEVDPIEDGQAEVAAQRPRGRELIKVAYMFKLKCSASSGSRPGALRRAARPRCFRSALATSCSDGRRILLMLGVLGN